MVTRTAACKARQKRRVFCGDADRLRRQQVRHAPCRNSYRDTLSWHCPDCSIFKPINHIMVLTFRQHQNGSGLSPIFHQVICNGLISIPTLVRRSARTLKPLLRRTAFGGLAGQGRRASSGLPHLDSARHNGKKGGIAPRGGAAAARRYQSLALGGRGIARRSFCFSASCSRSRWIAFRSVSLTSSGSGLSCSPESFWGFSDGLSC